MGISIAICETDSTEALCKAGKTDIKKVFLKDVKGFENYAESDMTMSAKEAKDMMGAEWEAFLKRNRIDPEAEVIYMDKVKNDVDRARLAPNMKKTYTGWVLLEKAPADVKKKIIEASSADDRLTGWDMLSFEEMGATCKKCGLSWDKGRGCIGDFGPESSLLPQIAKHNLPIVANVVEAPRPRRPSPMRTPRSSCARSGAEEKMPLEPKGKLLMSRYGGVLERLEGREHSIEIPDAILFRIGDRLEGRTGAEGVT
jgi:hypothetical protein